MVVFVSTGSCTRYEIKAPVCLKILSATSQLDHLTGGKSDSRGVTSFRTMFSASTMVEIFGFVSKVEQKQLHGVRL